MRNFLYLLAEHRNCMENVPEHVIGRQIPFPRGLVLFVVLIALMTFLPLCYLLDLYYIGLPSVQARLWSPASDRFGDFWHYRVLLQHLHRPEFFAARDRFAYPAPCALIYQALYSFGAHPHVSFNLMLWGVEAISGVMLVLALVRRRLATGKAVGLVLLMALTSHPWHMLYDRGNIELFVYTFVALGVWAWLRGNEPLAAVCWGCAGSLKLFPILMLAIFAKRQTWRYFALGLATASVILLFCFWYVGPSIALAAKGTMWGIRGFVGTYGAHSRFQELVFDHSLLGGLKEILAFPVFHRTSDRQIVLSHAYEGLVAVVGPLLFLRWRKTAPGLNQLCLLLTMLMLLPPVSYDYTLVYAYLVIGIVFCAMVSAASRGEVFPGTKGYVVCFALLCTAEQWIDLQRVEPNGLLKAASLITIAALLVRHPLKPLSLETKVFHSGSSKQFAVSSSVS